MFGFAANLTFLWTELPFLERFDVLALVMEGTEPVTVAVDSNGTSVHQTGPAEWAHKIAVGDIRRK